MAHEEGELRLTINEIKSQVKGLGEEIAKKLGHPGESVPSKEQTRTMLAMTDEDWADVVAQKGMPEAKRMMSEMLRRVRLQNANKKSVQNKPLFPGTDST